jgi:hypothetical protein
VSHVRLRVHWFVISTGRDADDIENTVSSIVRVGPCLQAVPQQRIDRICYNINAYKGTEREILVIAEQEENVASK